MTRFFRKTLISLCTVAIIFGLTTSSVLAVEVSDEDYKTLQAHKKKQAEKQLPPYEKPAPDHPAGSKAGNLAEAATNPIANLMQFQLQDSYNWDNYNSSGYSNSTVFQAVIPVPLPWKAAPLLITRTTLPYVTTPDFGGSIDRQRGFGDTDLLLLVTPKLKSKGIQIGLGTNIVIPSAGNNDFTGNGKWQAGPAFLYINMRTPKLQWGLFTYQNWDFASTSDGSDRPGVSKLSFQPFINKHFDKGWFVGSPESPQVYDFNADKWTWALGPQVGRVFKIGKRPVKMFGAIYYNPESDNGATPKWTAKVGITFLFPE
jgi:hypothetical protein